MEAVVMTYEGYALYVWGRAYKSLIGDEWIKFDTAGQWYQYINLIKNGNGKKRKTSHRN